MHIATFKTVGSKVLWTSYITLYYTYSRFAIGELVVSANYSLTKSDIRRR